MGIPVLIVGESGSGKTYSIKNIDPKGVGIFSVEKNRLPFKNSGFKVKKNAKYGDIFGGLKRSTDTKTFVIDDSQYLLVNEMFDRARETGYGKYTDMAVNFRGLIHAINHDLPDDVIVYFLHHSEYDNTSGRYKAKTIGKMIDQYLTVEGCFDIVLFTYRDNEGYHFVTQSDGTTTAKSPEGMFDLKIPNDLKIVTDKIREYYFD